MTELPPPLASSEDSIRGLSRFMLDTDRLLASELFALSTGEEFKAAVALWCRAWKQDPAGSLPNDDRVLAAFSGAGRLWPKVKAMALRGFVLCSDGRLYHRVLCEEVHAAAGNKKRHDARRAADRERLEEWRRKRKLNGAGTHVETPDETRFVAEETGRDGTVPKKEERKNIYAFEGRVVRLNREDHAAWRKAYPSIPDLDAELCRIDDALSADGKAKGWFPAASAMLAAKHQKNLERTKAASKSALTPFGVGG